MRLIQYSIPKSSPKDIHVGVELKGGEILDVASAVKHYGNALPSPFTMRTFLDMGEAGMNSVKLAITEGTGSRISAANVQLKAPIYDAQKVICVGMNYVDHCTEQNLPVPEEPVFFNKFPTSLAGPGDDLLLFDGQTNELDFEVEMVIVIGKEGRQISQKDAMNYVLGYTVAHDVSARDWQLKRNGGQWLLGKTFDAYAPIGPAIVTTDELGDPHNLGIRCFLNGKSVQDSNTKQLVFKTEFIIEWISKYVTLKPGDLILTGTPPGVGCFRKPQLFLKPGDVVTCEIDKIGAITNTVKAVSANL
mmetsp:Transcript_16849/g.32886  ORF Transcript_16849/g.32886 Transcript_16849/m.32886 type:complete len:304 (+) Transcript_16849:36-947(+)|eukprot:CAMPEP_0175141644 /NCGR_PEP_ID=MMETSP0087-20121206/12266_1 /TAXON_ID=136419 /ORGANISM="Unknown Unknown, Strain D1" /LENGTH=303 /DNA_ID=CAMNT_0016425175 /DNA_START=35 /DNA_END=946 /DNA_ORIENTATION=-